MRVANTYELDNQGRLQKKALASNRSVRPGWGSFVALLLIGISIAAGVYNEFLIEWGLAQGIVAESAGRRCADSWPAQCGTGC